MDWYDITDKYQQLTFRHECRLSSLPEDWQRELAALSRLEAAVNNGGYLQFFSNWDRESYSYASQALKKIGALKMAEIVDRCQALIDEHFNSDGASREKRQRIMPNPTIGQNGEVLKETGSILPDSVVDRVIDLSYEFMDYPEDLAQLGLKYYGPRSQEDRSIVDAECDDRKVDRIRHAAKIKLHPVFRFALILCGWICVPIAGQCLRSGRDGLGLLAAVCCVGFLYLGRKSSQDDAG